MGQATTANMKDEAVGPMVSEGIDQGKEGADQVKDGPSKVE